MHTKFLILLLTGIVVFIAVAPVIPASENPGGEKLILYGGSRGEVPFPHRRHQTALGDCQVCHTLFPQEKDSIEKLKSEGRLVTKQIMNKHCIKCHRTEKRAGRPSGPTSCSQCHVKK
jgi:hypothetical protein